MRRIARHSAFTLVELLVVIGIIAVLIAILLPTLSKARTQSRTVACMSNLRQIGIGLRTYAAEHQDLLPVGIYVYTNPNGSYRDSTTWANLINTYLTKNNAERGYTDGRAITKVFQCVDGTVPDCDMYYSAHPLAFPDYRYPIRIKPYRFGKLRPDTALVWDGAQFLDPSSGQYVCAFVSVNIDGGLFNMGYFAAGSADEEIHQRQWYMENDPRADDPLWGWNHPIETGFNEDSDRCYADIRWRHRDKKAGSPRGTANVLFADGRVETLGQKDFQRRSLYLKR